MRYGAILLVALAFQGNAFAQSHDFEAEAALALAKAKVKATATVPAGYEMVSINGGPWHLRKAPEVAAPKGQSFRHAGHNCPSCGFQSPAGSGTWIIRGYNSDGTHVHSCPQCGQSWSH